MRLRGEELTQQLVLGAVVTPITFSLGLQQHGQRP
jgi:nucleoside permease NupC